MKTLKFSISTMTIVIVAAVLAVSAAFAAPDVPPGGFSQSDIFIGGQEGYATYRIPALLLTPNGALLAICEARKNGPSDAGDINLILKRSLDNGKTWSAPILIWDDGVNTIGNPVPVADTATGAVILVFTKNNDTVHVTRSEDDGLTWSAPEDITADVKLPGWEWYAAGPGHGIQLRSGRLLAPCDHTEKNVIYSHVIFSDDGGNTWKLGGSSGKYTDEATAAELADGSVYLNSRSNHMKGMRAFAVSKDGGETFSDIRFEKAHIEPVCQASVARFSLAADGGRDRLLFSNPADRTRVKMTVKLSYDEARSWPVAKLVNLGKSGYSDLAALPDGSIALLYERGDVQYWEKITFARFTLDWLTDGKDAGGAPRGEEN